MTNEYVKELKPHNPTATKTKTTYHRNDNTITDAEETERFNLKRPVEMTIKDVRRIDYNQVEYDVATTGEYLSLKLRTNSGFDVKAFSDHMNMIQKICWLLIKNDEEEITITLTPLNLDAAKTTQKITQTGLYRGVSWVIQQQEVVHTATRQDIHLAPEHEQEFVPGFPQTVLLV